jgi:cell division protein FtsB
MSPGGSPWPYVNAKKAKEKAEEEIAALKARIKRLEGQILDLGQDPVP